MASGPDAPTLQVQITKFDDTGEKVEQEPEYKPQLVLNRITNPYPDQTPVQVLTRPYRVAEFTWGPGIITPNILNFPQTLRVIPAIASRLANFAFLRAGVKLQVKMNTTQFHYGAFMISWIPNTFTQSHANDVYQQSGNRAIVLSASLQNTCEIHIPWINPYSYCNAQTSNADIGRVWFTPLTPLGTANPNVTDTVSIQVFANFEDIEVSGYIANADSSAGAAVREMANKSRFAVETVGKTVNAVQNVLEQVPIIGDLVESFGSLVTLFDKPTSVQALQPVSMDFSRDFSRGDGMDHCRPLSLTTLTPVELDPALTGQQDREKDILKIAQTPMLHRLFVFNGPIGSPVSTDVHPFAQTNDAEIPGLPTTPDYCEFIARHFNYWRGGFKYHIYFYTSQFTSGRFRISVLYNSTLPDDNTSGDIISDVIDVRGDTAYARTVPYLWPTMYRSFQESLGGGIYPKLVIQQLIPLVGASMEEDPIIYCAIYRSAAEDIRFNQLVQYQTAGLPPSLTKNDIKVAVKKKKRIANADMDIRGSFDKTFPPIASGSCFIREHGTVSGEMISSISDCLKRYANTAITYGVADRVNVLDTNPDQTQFGAFHSFGRIFKYWNGSRRAVLTYNNTPTVGSTFQYLSMETFLNPIISAGNAMSYTSGTLWPQNTVEIPWYSSLPFLPVNANDVPINITGDKPKSIVVSDKATVDRLYLSGGDDFNYYFLVSPL
jgi:hypothetical protein